MTATALKYLSILYMDTLLLRFHSLITWEGPITNHDYTISKTKTYVYVYVDTGRKVLMGDLWVEPWAIFSQVTLSLKNISEVARVCREAPRGDEDDERAAPILG